MKRISAVLVALMLTAAQAQAQDVTTLCKVLSDQTGVPGAAYQPGVDVHGKPVVPADLNAPTPIGTMDVVKIPLTVDLAKRLNGPLPTGTRMESDVGTLEVRKDGSVTFNGQDLTQNAAILCGRAEPPQPAWPENPVPPAPPTVETPKVQPPPPNAFIPTPSVKPQDVAPKNPNYGTQPGTVLPAPAPDALTIETKPSQPLPITVPQGSDKPIKKDDIIWGQGN